jgi:hypothetical protein
MGLMMAMTAETRDRGHHMNAPNAITAFQDAYVEKVIDTLNDLPNVLWVVSEEAPKTSTWWNNHQISHIRAYESTKPHQHPIGYGAVLDAPDSTLYRRLSFRASGCRMTHNGVVGD